jgi:hypothetical protein
MLDGEGAELPQGASMASPIEQAIKQVAESQAQLAHMLESLGQHMANGHSENARMMAQAVMDASKPKRQRVVRDDKNRVVGVETIQ